MDRQRLPKFLIVTILGTALAGCHSESNTTPTAHHASGISEPKPFVAPIYMRPVAKLASHQNATSETRQTAGADPFGLPPIPPGHIGSKKKKIVQTLPIRIEKKFQVAEDTIKRIPPVASDATRSSKPSTTAKPLPSIPTLPVSSKPVAPNFAELKRTPAVTPTMASPKPINPPLMLNAASGDQQPKPQEIRPQPSASKSVLVEQKPQQTPQLAPPKKLQPPAKLESRVASVPPQPEPAKTAPKLPSKDYRAVFAVRERMGQLVDHGLLLAQRGAYFSARAEFIQALRLATQTLDTAEKTHVHSEALSAAIVAIDEASDFIPTGSRLEADVDLNLVIGSHRTLVLKDQDLQHETALTAAQRYFSFAQDRLTVACGGLPEASRALVGLGRIQEYLHKSSSDNRSMVGPRAIALYQSALVVDAANFEAANELGVLLSKFGQHHEAKQALIQGTKASPRPEIWRNLASVHQRLGEAEMARRATIEARLAEKYGPQQSPLDPVRWISQKEFADYGQTSATNKQVTNRSSHKQAR